MTGNERKATKLWQEAVKSQANWMCEKSGDEQRERLHSHHVIHRQNARLRYNIRNGVCLSHKEHQWAHNNPTDFKNWFKTVRPDDWKYLCEARNKIKQWSEWELKKQIKKLEKQIRLTCEVF